jgi:hypothetical protein
MFYQKKFIKVISSLLLIGGFFLEALFLSLPKAIAYESTDDTFIFYKQKIE